MLLYPKLPPVELIAFGDRLLLNLNWCFADKGYMKTLIFMLLSFQAHADDWFCTEEAGKRDGNVIWSCGVGESTTEDVARKKALLDAIEEFKILCSISADCEGRQTVVEPKRMTCKPFNGHTKCYRLIELHLI